MISSVLRGDDKMAPLLEVVLVVHIMIYAFPCFQHLDICVV